jgi:glutathione S-transferase
MDAATPSRRVPALLIPNDPGAVAADAAIARMLVRATAPREAADTLTVGRRTRRTMRRAACLMRYQHRSPIR